MSLRMALAAALIAIAAPALAAAENTNWPNYREGDFVIADCGGSGHQHELERRVDGRARSRLLHRG